MADGRDCSFAACEYITDTKVPDYTEMQFKLTLLQLQMQELFTVQGVGQSTPQELKLRWINPNSNRPGTSS